MIRFDRVELLHWDIQEHQVLPLATGVTLITGENGSGKTSILDAIKVGLGARSLGDERRITDYVIKQARPVAMVRILVDNRPDPAGRRRPFDPLASMSQDVVTLAVVFRAIEEKEYARQYYILDGDVVPLVELEGGRRSSKPAKLTPLPSASEYRARLKKVGIGPQYLKLLCLPQGQIARLCSYGDTELFEKLYDIIGGHSTLENWEKQLMELSRLTHEQKDVATERETARKNLKTLEAMVGRHHKYLEQSKKLRALRAAGPHVELRIAREESARYEEDVKTHRKEREHHIEVAEQADGQSAEASLRIEQLGVRRDDERRREQESRKELYLSVREHSAAQNQLKDLESLRARTAQTEWRDIFEIETQIDRARAEVAGGDAREAGWREEAGQIRAELDQIERGLLPIPEDVRLFRERLRREGIVHHILYEVVELQDEAWAEAVEGFFGRYRFAVMVQDPNSWPAAARIAREMRYPHGVLAPDVKGASKRDDSSLAQLLEIKEPRYRSLISRLLRSVVPGEHAEPLTPTVGGSILARDGFEVSRIEARTAREERLYLGLLARQRRKEQLTEELEKIEEARRSWGEKRRELKGRITRLENDLADQKALREWEEAKHRHAELKDRVSNLDVEIARLEERGEALRSELELLAGRIAQEEAARRTARERGDQARKELERLEKRIAQIEHAKKAVDEGLGRLLGDELPELDDDAKALLNEITSLDVLATLRRETEKHVAEFSAEERDSMLPLNLARQSDEVTAVENRLKQLAENLESTKKAAERARDEYQQATRRVFRHYFGRLKEASSALDFSVEGKLEPRENGKFSCDIRVRVGEKAPVHYNSEELSGGQKAALSILMGMTAVSLEHDGAGFFLIDEPFAASDVIKINELGQFLRQTGAQYLVSMPTSADLEQCRDWLAATWTCTRSRGGFDPKGRPVLAPPVKLGFTDGARHESPRA